MIGFWNILMGGVLVVVIVIILVFGEEVFCLGW